MLGRRPPLVAGVLLFIVSGIGCALAGSIEQLIAFRLLQGFGGSRWGRDANETKLPSVTAAKSALPLIFQI